MKIIHHNDLDGRCAAAIVLLKHPDAECIEMDYKDDVPFDRIEWNEVVYIVDFSLQKTGDWQRLFKITHSVVWIDHHETAIKRFDDENSAEYIYGDEEEIPGLRRTDRCGAWLTWEYLFPEEPAPHVVDLVDCWDRWVHNDDEEVLNFRMGADHLDPGGTDWELLLLHPDSEALEYWQRQGKTIRNHIERDAARQMKNAYEIAWRPCPMILQDGHDFCRDPLRCLVLNTAHAGSKLFDSRKDLKRDILIAWQFVGDQYVVHLYSEIIKVNDIAAHFGGGGHPGAAGFQCKNLPWEDD